MNSAMDDEFFLITGGVCEDDDRLDTTLASFFENPE